MKLSISNIAWSEEQDEIIYSYMKQYGFTGLEIAPTRWFSERPYDKIQESQIIGSNLLTKYGFAISSIQSIWYGINENIFDSESSYTRLLNYTKKAIIYAEALECKNLVFGCPKNRNIPEGMSDLSALKFFRELGKFASFHHTVLSIEPNPVIYHTNYINTTLQAIQLVGKLNSEGIKVNLDIGTIIENNESLDFLKNNISILNHIHISEPNLERIKKRSLHRELAEILRKGHYSGYVSIEMKRTEDLKSIEETLEYISEVFE